MDRVIIKEFRSPFRYTEPRIIELEPTRYLFEASLADIRRANLPAVVPFVFLVNDRLLKEHDLPVVYLSPSDTVIAIPYVGDDDIFPMIVGILFAIAAIAISGGTLAPLFGAAFSAGGLGAIATSMAVSIMGGIVTSMLTKAPDIPTMDLMGGYNTTQIYSWNPQTTQQQGSSIPRLYGQNKVYGNVIAWHIDNVNNTQYLNVLICLGVGPVSRLYNHRINDQPISNYRGVEIHTRLGWLDQDPIPNFNDTKRGYVISPIKIAYGSPVTYTTVDDDFNGIAADITFPQGLWYANDQGGLDTVSVNITVQIRKHGSSTWIPITRQVVTTQETYYDGKWSCGLWLGGDMPYWEELAEGSKNPGDHYEGERSNIMWPGSDYIYGTWRWITEQRTRTVQTTVNHVTISGNSNTAIRRTFRMDGLAPGRYDIMSVNHSPDQTSSRYGDDCYLTAVWEIYEDDFEYPRMVLVGIRALGTDQLSGSLRYSCYMDGALVQATIDGETWNTGFSRRPAWIGYDVLTRPVLDNGGSVVRYDGILPGRTDVDAHLELAEYNALQVPDGRGGTEELCLFDGGFDHGTTVWDALLKVYRIGRAVPYYAGTKVTLSINRPEEISPEENFLVGMGSVLKDSFKQHWSSVEDRPTELNVEILNSDSDFAREPLQVINPNLVSYQPPLNMDMFGVIRPSQVWRDGLLRLNANEHLTNTVSVSLPVSAIECRIGQVINISHDVPQWGYSGRIAAAPADNEVVLDRDVHMEQGRTYGIIIWLKEDEPVYRQVLAVEEGSTLILNEPFEGGKIPEKYDSFAFGEIGKIAKPFRILSILPDMEHRFRLTCLEYNDTIWNYDTEQPVLPTPDYSAFENLPPVTSLALRERLVKNAGGGIDEVVEVTFVPPTGYIYDHAEIWYNRDGIGWTYAGSTWASVYSLPVVPMSHYTIAVVTVNRLGLKLIPMNAPQATIVPLGKTAPPADVEEFWASPAQGGVRLDWSAVPDLDIDHYLLRYSPDPGGSWNGAVEIAKIYSTSITLPAALSGMYLLKAVDTSGNESANAIGIITDIPSVIAWNALEQLTEEPAFTGTKTNMSAIGGRLYLDSRGKFDDIADFDGIGNFDTLDSDYHDEGSYELDPVDLGSVQTARVSMTVEYLGIDSESVFDDIADFDGIVSFDGDVTGIGVQTQIALSQNGVDFGDWQNFQVGDYTTRAVKTRILVHTVQPRQYVEVFKVHCSIDMPDRDETGQDLLISVSGETVLFRRPFMVRPLIGITIQSAQQGDHCELSNAGVNGFDLVIKNISGNPVERSVDWFARAY